MKKLMMITLCAFAVNAAMAWELRDATGRIVISQLKTEEGGAVEDGLILVDSPGLLIADSADVATALAPRIAVIGKPWYTATADGAVVRFVLNEKAKPVIGDFDLGAVSDAGPVQVSVENGKPNLRYALGWSESPAGDFAAHLTEEDWFSADAYGRVGPLTAPKGDEGRFYRLLVRPE